MQDASLIVNVRRVQPGERVESFHLLRYQEVGAARQLMGRVTIIDTDIKPADRVPQYARTLQEYCSHQHVEHLRAFLQSGQTLDESLSSVQSLVDQSPSLGDSVHADRIATTGDAAVPKQIGPKQCRCT